jgi:NAD(P)-dependent dehydrogenase (short-subunit alcohol dehydrogenase family)
MAAAILITGANRGLGFEFASQYLADGWRVFAACRNPDAASKLRCWAQDTGGMLNVVAMDVTDAESVQNAKYGDLLFELDVEGVSTERPYLPLTR